MNKKIFYGLGALLVGMIILLVVGLRIRPDFQSETQKAVPDRHSLVTPEGEVFRLREDIMFSPNMIMGYVSELINESEFKMIADFGQMFEDAAGYGKEIRVKVHPDTAIVRSGTDANQTQISLNDLRRGDLVTLALFPGETVFQLFEREIYNPFRINHILFPLPIIN